MQTHAEAAAQVKNRRNAEGTASAAPGNPLTELLAEEQRERVRNVITSQLNTVQGQVVFMCSGGFTCKEISVLGVKPDSLYVLISRAKAQFEKEYVNLYGRA